MKNVQQESGKLFTPAYTCALLSQSLQVIASFILVISLPMFLVDRGYSSVVVGLLASVMTISTVISRIIAGRLADMYGRKLVFLLSMVLSFLAATLYYYLSDTLILLFALRILHGIASGMSTAASGSLLADIVPRDRLDQAIGLNNISVQLGIGFGSVISIPLISTAGYGANFLLVSVISGVSLLLAFFLPVRDERTKPDSARPQGLKGIGKSILSLFDFSALIPASVMIPVYFAFCTISNYLALYAADIQLTNISVYYAVNCVASIIVSINVTTIRKWLGFRRMVMTGVLSVAAGFVLIALAGGTLPLVAAALLMSYGMGLLAPTMNAQLFSFADASRKTTANATYHSVLDLSQALGTLLWGGIAASFGYRNMFAVCAVSALLGIVALRFIFIKKQEKVNVPSNM